MQKNGLFWSSQINKVGKKTKKSDKTLTKSHSPSLNYFIIVNKTFQIDHFLGYSVSFIFFGRLFCYDDSLFWRTFVFVLFFVIWPCKKTLISIQKRFWFDFNEILTFLRIKRTIRWLFTNFQMPSGIFIAFTLWQFNQSKFDLIFFIKLILMYRFS